MTLKNYQSSYKNPKGTSYFIAPEVYVLEEDKTDDFKEKDSNEDDYVKKSDVYSYGIQMYKVLIESVKTTFVRKKKQWFRFIIESYRPSFKKLIQSCWSKKKKKKKKKF